AGTVILIHGLSNGIESQLEKTKSLLEAGFNVIAYDQRGYGQSGGDYRSGGFMEGTDLQSLISRLDLEERIVRPLIVWGEEHGATGALRAWIDEDRIDYLIAAEPVVDGRDWQKRIIAQKDITAPDLYLPIIWWWMNQKSSYSINLDESDISDQFGILTERYPGKLLIIASGENDTPQNSYLSELRDLGGDWMIMNKGESSLFENNKALIIERIVNIVEEDNVE
ncbi:MAG: alpha/beta hydrolase, partial [Planctomycetes bacterium]|nr:alpha/beta hydrolase [Planctomycetota bacterium]